MGRIGVLSSLVLAILAGAQPTPSLAQQLRLDQRISHPDGVSILLENIAAQPDSIVLRAKISNPTDRRVSLDRAQSFVVADDAHDVHRLNAPLDDPQLSVAPHAQFEAALVFIGSLSPAARDLTLSTNEGVGTTDNPYDDAPVLRATLRVGSLAGSSSGYQSAHPDGVTLRVDRLAATSARCIVSLHASNGNERTVVLNQGRGLLLSNDRGISAPVFPAADNAELVVPAGSRLDAKLVFDCRALAGASEVTLWTNRGTAGTADNPYETLPVMSLRLPVEHLPDGSAEPQRSEATVSPIARSVLTASATMPVASQPVSGIAAATVAPPAAAAEPMSKPPSAAAAVAPAEPSPKPQTPPVAAATSPQSPQEPPPKAMPELEAALHVTRGYHGLEVVLPADALFGSSRDTLEAGAGPALTALAALISRTHPRDVVVAGNTDSNGDDAAQVALSKAQAHAVAAWLEARLGKRRPRFIETGYGRSRPIAPNHKADGSDNPEGRAQNRRVEITLRR